jgi:cytochrome c553
MRHLTLCAIGSAIVCLTAAVAGAQTPPKEGPLTWAYPVPIPGPAAGPANVPKTLSGSTRSYTQAQIDDQFSPPDWFPDQHGALPRVVQTGIQAQACGSCHLMSGMGHPESAELAGLPLNYFLRQMADFKSGDRKEPKEYDASQRAARMNNIAAGLPEEEMRKAAEWFSSLKPVVWYKVVEAQTVPKSWISAGRMRLPLPGGGTEPLGNRIITIPQDPEKVELRDPRSGFIAYVPMGSIKKGEALVTKPAAGKTVACAVCHGEGLKGLGDVPRIAGVHPIYVVRQLYNFQTDANKSSAGALMKQVVKNLSQDDMVAIAAYTASLEP